MALARGLAYAQENYNLPSTSLRYACDRIYAHDALLLRQPAGRFST